MHRTRLLLCAALLALPAGGQAAYEARDVDDGGRIVGYVRLGGNVPKVTSVPVQKDVTVCGQEVEERSLLVGDGAALRNAVVFLADVETGKPIDVDAEAVLDNLKCRFEPHVQTLSVGQWLTITNSDPVLHNTHSYVLEGEKGNRFNLALPRQNTKVRKLLRNPGVHQVKCDAGHTWMNAYFLVFEHPYHVVTSADGAFALEDVPPGEYTLTVWHEKLGRTSTSLRVQAGKTTTLPDLHLELSKSKN